MSHRSRSLRFDPLRLLAAVFVAGIGGIHLYLYFYYFHTVHIFGPLFIANCVVGVVLALWLLFSDGVLPLIAGAGYAATTVIAFLINVKWGYFGFQDSFSGSWQFAAGLLEIVTAAMLSAMAARPRPRRMFIGR
jgi:hypothetical protein